MGAVVKSLSTPHPHLQQSHGSQLDIRPPSIREQLFGSRSNRSSRGLVVQLLLQHPAHLNSWPMGLDEELGIECPRTIQLRFDFLHRVEILLSHDQIIFRHDGVELRVVSAIVSAKHAKVVCGPSGLWCQEVLKIEEALDRTIQ